MAPASPRTSDDIRPPVTDTAEPGLSGPVDSWTVGTHGAPSLPPSGAWSALDAQRTAALIDLIAELGDCDDLARACHLLTNRLQTLFQCDQVMVGLCGGPSIRQGPIRSCRLHGLSRVAKFDKHSELASAMNAALDDTVIRADMTVWTGDGVRSPLVPMTHKVLCKLLQSDAIVGAPLRDARERTIGAWLFVGPRSSIEAFGMLECLRAYEQPIASCLRLLQRSEIGVVRRSCQAIGRSLSRRRAVSATIAIALLMLAMLIPFPFRIGCDVDIEPVLRRFVAAPFDGTLDASLVEPGDLVAKGDVIARMDGREIEWELAGRRAERLRAEKRRDTAMARHQPAAAQQAQLESARLQLKIELLEDRRKNLEIRSPLTGIVITGDLRRSEGAPLTVGQPLFEIAPLDRMIVELAVPETEVHFVETGAEVTVRVHAARQTLDGTLDRIMPRAVVREGETVFIGEVLVANPTGRLRPGMSGYAKIMGASRPLGWILFHPMVEALARVVGW
ncbi:MAG: efflux RND transporter periplasmic adaptor subunit [Pirellulales bacterium]